MKIIAETLELRKKAMKDSIDCAITDIDAEIDLIKEGIKTSTASEILVQIKEELIQMKISLSPSKYKPTYNFVIRDSWRSYDELGDKLLKVFHDYMNKLV